MLRIPRRRLRGWILAILLVGILRVLLVGILAVLLRMLRILRLAGRRQRHVLRLLHAEYRVRYGRLGR